MNFKLTVFTLMTCLGGFTVQAHAEDTLQSLAVESQLENKKMEQVYEKIKDPNRLDQQELRCNDLLELVKKRIDINERAIKLVPKGNAQSFQDQIDTHKKFLADTKAQFNCQ